MEREIKFDLYSDACRFGIPLQKMEREIKPSLCLMIVSSALIPLRKMGIYEYLLAFSAIFNSFVVIISFEENHPDVIKGKADS